MVRPIEKYDQSSSFYLSQPIIPMAWLEPKEVFKFLKLTELLNNCRTSKVLIPFFSMYIISTVNQYRPIPLVKLYIYFIYCQTVHVYTINYHMIWIKSMQITKNLNQRVFR